MIYQPFSNFGIGFLPNSFFWVAFYPNSVFFHQLRELTPAAFQLSRWFGQQPVAATVALHLSGGGGTYRYSVKGFVAMGGFSW
jgi:uncharacterized membrane protein